jgi:hypothetical protein
MMANCRQVAACAVHYRSASANKESKKKMKAITMVLSVACVGLLALPGCVGTDYEEPVAAAESAISSACYSSYGLNPSKAALAVAMATELGRWDPLKDLEVVNGNWQTVRLKASAVCIRNSCKQTKALLGQQDFTPDQTRFSNTNFANDLVASFGRQYNLISDLTRNRPAQLPPAHKLTPVGSMTLTGACGPHYIFQVDNTNGTALTSTQAGLMSNTLCYYGQNTANTICGYNGFVGFTMTQTKCPSGRVCVAIDPDDGDAGSGTTTTAGSAPTYTLNRLWDPANTKLNTACTKSSGPLGKMQSKCSSYPSTCGYLYCM